MNNILQSFPGISDLQAWHQANPGNTLYSVNGHIHSPYSFSSFQNLEEAFQMAHEENVRVLGINDFYTTTGYNEFYALSLKYHIFPLFNIEFMGLMEDEMRKGIRINDPNNPGRIYFCGKGLDFPVNFNSGAFRKLENVCYESQKQTTEMLRLASDILKKLDSRLFLDLADVLKNYTKGMLRERHIARAIRIKVFEYYTTSEDRKAFLTRLYGGKETVVDINDHSAVENEIRSELLKAGGKAYVREDQEAFMKFDEIISIIYEAGGIPFYPVLLDDSKGNLTEFEGDYEKLYHNLTEQEVYCIELIPGRNNIEKVREFVNFFHSRKFVVIFGTEHNTPDLTPVTVKAKGETELDDQLKKISYEGACVIAAHQYLRAKGHKGYYGKKDDPVFNHREEFIDTGKAVINYFI